MGVCCCKSQSVAESELSQQTTQKLQTSNVNHKEQPQQSTDAKHINQTVVDQNNTTHEVDIDEQDHDELEREYRSPTQHWKTETLQILSLISIGMADLDPEFEDLYDDTQYAPKELINIPRKSYVKPYQMITETDGLPLGTTLTQTTDKNQKHVWRSCHASTFNVRGPQYVTNKKNKLQISKPALYEVFAMDCYAIDDKDAMDQDVHEMINCFNIQNINKLHTHYPNLLIISLMIPLFKKKDRNGVHLVIYSTISKEFERILSNNETLPCITRLDKLLNLEIEALNSFKMTLSIPNIDETNLNQISKKLVKTINGKCMAFKKHASFGYLNGKSESDVFVVRFNGFGLNKNIIKALSVARSHLQTMDFEIGFHVGAKQKELLPERMLTCAKLIKIDINNFGSFDTFSTDEDNVNMGHDRVDTYVMDGVLD
eukprot:169489_1